MRPFPSRIEQFTFYYRGWDCRSFLLASSEGRVLCSFKSCVGENAARREIWREAREGGPSAGTKAGSPGKLGKLRNMIESGSKEARPYYRRGRSQLRD